MEAKFVGDPANSGDGPASVTIQGVEFRKEQWTPVQAGSALARKLPGHSHFETREPSKGVPVKKPAAE